MPKQTHPTKKQDKVPFSIAFYPKRDTAVGLILPTVNTEMMQMHLDEISSQLPTNVHAAMLMLIGGAGWHLSVQNTNANLPR